MRDLWTFWKRRWLRTLPNYFLILLINCLLFIAYSNELPKTLTAYFIFIQNFLSPHPQFFKEAWSLSIEEYAYFILPLIMFIGFLCIRKNQKTMFLWTTLGVIFIVQLMKFRYYLDADHLIQKSWTSTFRKVVVYRLDAIYIGFLLVFYMRRYAIGFKKLRYVLLVSGLVLFVGTHLLIYIFKWGHQAYFGFYVFVYLLTISVSCALVFPYAVHMKRVKIFSGVIYFISTRSYAIYLVNFSVVLLSIHHFFYTGQFSLSFASKILLLILFISTTFMVSNLLYVYFEKPILRYRDKNLK